MAWCLLHKSFWHLQLIPGLRLPSGHHRILALEWENPSNHHSLRNSVLVRFILVCECSCTSQLQCIFITCFVKNDSTWQMVQCRGKSGPSYMILHFWIFCFTCIVIFGLKHKNNNKKLWNNCETVYSDFIEEELSLGEIKEILQGQVERTGSRLSSRFLIPSSVLSSVYIRNLP